jgi:hypothetical protein
MKSQRSNRHRFSSAVGRAGGVCFESAWRLLWALSLLPINSGKALLEAVHEAEEQRILSPAAKAKTVVIGV